MSGIFAVERAPTAQIRNWAEGAHAGAGLHRPTLRRFVVAGVLHPGLELDVAAEVETIGDVLEVGEHGGLLGLGLGPVPLVHELVRERVAVEGATGPSTRAPG